MAVSLPSSAPQAHRSSVSGVQVLLVDFVPCAAWADIR